MDTRTEYTCFIILRTSTYLRYERGVTYSVRKASTQAAVGFRSLPPPRPDRHCSWLADLELTLQIAECLVPSYTIVSISARSVRLKKVCGINV